MQYSPAVDFPEQKLTLDSLQEPLRRGQRLRSISERALTRRSGARLRPNAAPERAILRPCGRSNCAAASSTRCCPAPRCRQPPPTGAAASLRPSGRAGRACRPPPRRASRPSSTTRTRPGAAPDQDFVEAADCRTRFLRARPRPLRPGILLSEYGMPEEAVSITRATSAGGSTVSPSPAFAEKCLPQSRRPWQCRRHVQTRGPPFLSARGRSTPPAAATGIRTRGIIVFNERRAQNRHGKMTKGRQRVHRQRHLPRYPGLPRAPSEAGHGQAGVPLAHHVQDRARENRGGRGQGLAKRLADAYYMHPRPCRRYRIRRQTGPCWRTGPRPSRPWPGFTPGCRRSELAPQARRSRGARRGARKKPGCVLRLGVST